MTDEAAKMASDNVKAVAVPTVTKLGPETVGSVVVGGSHAAIYTTYLTLKAGARAAIQHDAAFGRDQAGIRGLAWAEPFGFVVAGLRSGRIPILLPGAEETVTWRLIPVECGHVSVPRMRIMDKRRALPTGQRDPNATSSGAPTNASCPAGSTCRLSCRLYWSWS